jgi:hypothetical protein
MDFKNIVLNSLYEEAAGPKNGKGILFLDIDDTLLTAQNIYIYRKLPTDKKEVALTPEEYAHETVTNDTKQYYDYRDFRNPEKVAGSIVTGLPIVPNLKMMDIHVKNGWKIGILTARGMEDVIFKSISAFLKFKDPKGELQSIGDKLVRNLVHAMNDDNKKYQGSTDFEKKANVLRNYAKQGYKIKFLDDDDKNIQAVRKMAKEENLDIIAVKAAKRK